MKQAVRRSGAPNIHEGRALTLKVLKAPMALSRNGRRAVPKEEADEGRTEQEKKRAGSSNPIAVRPS
jgi:hypothetical protein